MRATATHEVWVPALWLLDTSNLLPSARRRRRITADQRLQLASAAAALRVRVDRDSPTIVVPDRVASRHALGAHDATCLELAMRRGLPLATRDQALLDAMIKAGVPAYAPPS